ncbi:MAG: TetR/AcrR family transcriptional regulator [Pseudomonadota bacterium]
MAQPLRRTTEAPQATRDACIAAAHALLDEVGPEQLSLRAVARGAGVSSMAPYRHFESKEALLAELARQGFAELGASVREGCPNGVHLVDFDQFRAMAECYVAFAERRPALYRLMFSGVISDHRAHEALWRDSRWSFEVVIAAIEVLQKDGRFREGRAIELALHVWSVMHGFVSLELDRLMGGRGSMVERFRPHIDLLLHGLCSPTE